MERDLRETGLYREIEALYKDLRQPRSGSISDAVDVHVAPDGRRAVFAGTIVDKLEGAAPTRIGLTDLSTGDTRVMTFGPNTDRLPKFSPDGRWVAFLSDREREGNFQLYMLDPASGAARPMPPVEGWVEYLHWSPDGKRILLGVAGHGADIAGGQGAVTSKQIVKDLPAWMPPVETGKEGYRWRRAWIYDLAARAVRPVSQPDVNIWETVWSGNDRLAAVASPGPGEGLWYTAHLHVIDIASGRGREIYVPKDQLGCPASSPSGKYLAVVEATCSDRWIVAGELLLIDTGSDVVRRVDTHGVDISYTEWRSERKLLLSGHRGLETVVGLSDADSGAFTEVWRSSETSAAGIYSRVSGFNEHGDCAFSGTSFTRAPEIGAIRNGEYRTVRSFDVGYARHAKVIDAVERVNWQASDGLQIQGWLLRPKGLGPYPLVLNAHGGPVWHWRPAWIGPLGLTLLRRGYAIFMPNPRGSSGRGREFVLPVYGDMGGADARDLLAGIDALVERGIADPKRLGVTGGSYGAFMTAWLITQDTRFAAAVPASPHTNAVSEHLISNIPHFMALFLGDRYDNPGGKYFERSPVMHAHKVKTPTLSICGALDRCTPPEEAVQFHNALSENGVKSVLVTYPEEGHGIRKFPAAIDYAARVVAWFEEHMPAGSIAE